MADSAPMPRTPRRTEIRLSIRVTPEVYEALRGEVEQSRRSLNREVEVLIDEALAARRWARRAQGLPRVAEGHGPPYRPSAE